MLFRSASLPQDHPKQLCLYDTILHYANPRSEPLPRNAFSSKQARFLLLRHLQPRSSTCIIGMNTSSTRCRVYARLENGIQAYSGEGGKYWDKQGDSGITVISSYLTFLVLGTPSMVYARVSATPACPNTSPLPLILTIVQKRTLFFSFC